MVGQAFSLNGTSAYVSVPDAASLDPTNAITVEAWINPAAHVGPYDPIVKKAGEGSQQQDGYTLEFAGNNLVFLVYISGTGWVASPQVSVPLGQWSYVAGTYSAGSGLSLYVNGQLVGTTVVGGQMSPSGNTLDIGHDPSNADRWYDGLIDEPSVYNRALSPAEIQWIYNAGSAGKHQTITGSASLTVGTSSPSPLLASSSSGGAPADPTGTATAPLPAGRISSGAATSSAGSAAILADHLFSLVGEETAFGAHSTPQAVIVNGLPFAPAPLPRFDALLSMGAGARTMGALKENWMRDLLFASLS